MSFKLRHLVGMGVAAMLTLAVAAPAASADPFVGPPICSSAGAPIAGSYRNVVITGNRYVASGTSLHVGGNLIIAPGACLDAFTLGTVWVGENVLVGKGAILALGCSPGAIGPEPPCETNTTDDIVGGSILANQPWTLYLTAVTVVHNVVSLGGGPGETLSPYINFPIKEMDIGGNLTVAGWKGAWFGALRNDVHGNATFLDNVGLTISEETEKPDSTEIVTNTIGGNLTCFGNNPPAQYGDSGGSPNKVGGHTYGQCRAVV